METKKNIFLVDDHVIVRNGLKELVEKLGPYQVTGQFDTGEDFLDALPHCPAPDLVIMDLNMPGRGGVETVETLKAEGKDLAVMALTLDSDNASVVRLFRAGVRGFLKKDCSADTLREALEAIFKTGCYYNEYMVYSLQNPNEGSKKTERDHILGQLTEREREFLKLVCNEREYTYDQIAGHMNVQHRTVDGYREAIFDKFGIKSKTGLVLFVLKHQLMEAL